MNQSLNQSKILKDSTGATEALGFIIKEIYKLSKDATNDKSFIEEGILQYILEMLATLTSFEIEDIPKTFVLQLLNTVKNITGKEEVRKKLLDVKNIEIFSKLLWRFEEVCGIKK